MAGDGERMIKCPGCDLELREDDVYAQMEHMASEHPDIIAERMKELSRYDGWEDG